MHIMTVFRREEVCFTILTTLRRRLWYNTEYMIQTECRTNEEKGTERRSETITILYPYVRMRVMDAETSRKRPRHEMGNVIILSYDNDAISAL